MIRECQVDPVDVRSTFDDVEDAPTRVALSVANGQRRWFTLGGYPANSRLEPRSNANRVEATNDLESCGRCQVRDDRAR